MLENRRRCFACGTALPPGELAYQVRVEMAADFDGFIDGDLLGSCEEMMLSVPTAAAARTSEELTEEVYRERIFLFCPRCAESAWETITQPRTSI